MTVLDGDAATGPRQGQFEAPTEPTTVSADERPSDCQRKARATRTADRPRPSEGP